MPRKNRQTSEAAVREIRRRTRRKFSAEEAGKSRLNGDTVREATSDEVK